MEIIRFCLLNSSFVELATLVLEIVLFLWAIKTFKSDRKSRANDYISNYNSQFIFNDDEEFKLLDRKLEAFAVQCKEGKKDSEKHRAILKKLFPIDSEYRYLTENKYAHGGEISKEYQAIVNYLVYLEAISPMILKKEVSLDVVGDLFGYKFFIACHNPVMQNNELLAEREYYQGCIKAYKKWYEYCEKNGKDIPLKQYSLYDDLFGNYKRNRK